MQKTTEPAERRVALRMSARLAHQVERVQARLAKQTPGQRVTFSDALRRMLEAAAAGENA